MEELDDVATSVLTSLRALEVELTDAERALDDLETALDGAGQGAEAACLRVVSAAEMLQSQVDPQQAALAETGEQARAALAGAESVLSAATQELEAASTDAGQSLRALGNQAVAAESETLPTAAQAGERIQRLLDEIAAAETELDALASEASALLSEELPGALRASARAIQARSEAFERCITEEALPLIESESSELAERLDAFLSEHNRQLTRIADVTEQLVRSAVAGCLAEHNRLLVDLDQRVRQAVQELEELGRRLESGEQKLLDSKRTLAAQRDSAESDISRAAAALREVQSFFARQGFIGG